MTTLRYSYALLASLLYSSNLIGCGDRVCSAFHVNTLTPFSAATTTRTATTTATRTATTTATTRLLSKKKTLDTFEVTTVSELNDYFKDTKQRFRKNKKNRKSQNDDDDEIIDYDSLLKSVIVKGDTQKLGSKPTTSSHDDGDDGDDIDGDDGDDEYFLHSVQKIIHERRRRRRRSNAQDGNGQNDTSASTTTTNNSNHDDNHKVALVVEGGGMRGCVTAGMVTAIHYLGLEDTFDVIYGSSAGTMIGAYFNARQLPWFGPEVYYDSLTTADKAFIDTKRLLRSVGVGLLDPRLLKDVVFRPKFGKPVLNLDYLLHDTMQVNKPLDWTKFVEMQKIQPLKVVASGLHAGESIVLDYENGGFQNIQELASAMRSSCLLPGIAGPIVNVRKERLRNRNDSDNKKYVVGNNVASSDANYEPLADALIYEPLPYRTALKEGATHVVMLRSRPDGADVTGKISFFEKLILHRFFKRKNKLSHIYDYMRRGGHKQLYAKQVIELNEASNDAKANMMAIAVPPGSPEVPRLETGRKAIFDGVRRGFARAYDCLVEDPAERGRGVIVAKQVFPDEILDYDPLSIDSGDLSAFQAFLDEKEANGEGYDFPPALGKAAGEANLPR